MKTLRCRLTRDGTESPGGRTPRYRRQASMAGVLSRRCLLVSRRRAGRWWYISCIICAYYYYWMVDLLDYFIYFVRSLAFNMPIHFSIRGFLRQNRVKIRVENRLGDPIFHPILNPILAPKKPRTTVKTGQNLTEICSVILVGLSS